MYKLLGIFIIFSAVVFGGYSWWQSGVEGAATLNSSKQYSLRDGLVGYWTFDGKDMVSNVADVSGQGNNGSLTGQTSTTTAVGRIGQALSFDGVNDYTLVPDNDSLSVTTKGTWSAWINPTSFVDYRTIIRKDTALGNDREYVFTTDITTGKLKFVVQGINGEGQSIFTGTNALSLNAWSHVVATYDGANIRFYINGILDSTSGSVTQSFGNGTSGLYIGYSGIPAGTQWMYGSLDDIRIYNRTLSASEVAQLYHHGTSATLNSSKQYSLRDGLVGYWTFDGKDMVSNVADVSGQGNNGGLQGQTSTTTAVGRIGQALSFDGVDDYTASALNKTTIGSTPSISLWIKPINSSPATPGIISIGNTPQTAVPWLVLKRLPTGTQTRWFLNAVNAIDESSINDNVWTHLVVTYDGTTWRAYKNGVADGTYVGPLGSNSGNNTYLGVDSGGYFPGQIDDVRIYNRTLSASEVAQLYHHGTSATVNSSKQYSLRDGLVGYWTFDGKDMVSNVADVSGQGNNGGLQGQTSTTTAVGRIGQALSFDGVDDYVNKGTFSQPTSAMSYSVWVKASQTPAQYDSLGGNSDSGWNSGWALEYGGNAANRLEFWINVFSTNYAFASYSNITEWHHVVGTFDGTTIRIYIDGVEGTSDTYVSTISSQNALRIGSTVGTSNRNFPGTLDDVRIYNRALSASEVAQLYNMGR